MQTPEIKYLKDYKTPEYMVESIDLYISLDEDITSIKSTMNINRSKHSIGNSDSFILNGEDIELKSVRLDGKLLDSDSYRLDDEFLVLYNVPDQFEIVIVNAIHPEKNTSLEGLYKTDKMFCTQCEAEGFRKITFFPDRPDVMSLFTCTIEADIYKYPVILSNGNLKSSGNLNNGRHWATWEDPFKKPAYLFALVAGDLSIIEDTFITMSGRSIDLRIYVEHENRDKCDHAMVSLKKSMKWDEDRFGREYDLDLYMIVATNDFNMGAMENKGLNVFNSKYVLAKPETATDNDYEGIEAVIAHEYFHNWTGNRVTLNSWFQLSLKEGLTVFRDQEFSSDMNSRAVQRINNVINLRIRQFPEDAGPMAHPIRPESYIEMNNFYTMTVYEKGSEVIRMIYTILGEGLFRKGMDLYFERYDGQAVTTEDFVKTMEDASQIDLTQFRLWYSQAGTPEINVTRNYDESSSEFKLTLTQNIPNTPGQDNKKDMHIPIRFALLDKSGNEFKHDIADNILHLTEKEQTFVFSNIKEMPVPSLLRGFSAPVKLNINYSDDELIFLASNETDEFNRWEAGQKLYLNTLHDMINNIQNNVEFSVPNSLIEAFKITLQNKKLDKSLIALAISLPAESDIWERMDVIDVDAVHFARESLFKYIAEKAEDLLLDIYKENIDDVYTMDAKNIARRKLKNVVLNYLGYIKDQKYIDLVLNQFSISDNMTDRITALSILVDIDSKQSIGAIQSFYEDWKHDVLVLDKWFAIQAVSKLDNTLENVLALLEHPAFSIQNPNKVRSLIGAFCNSNRINFHRIDGRGYQFLTKAVIALNNINPQIASRMVSLFNQWKRFDDTRKGLMEAELIKISKIDNLSKDVFEIVKKALA